MNHVSNTQNMLMLSLILSVDIWIRHILCNAKSYCFISGHIHVSSIHKWSVLPGSTACFVYIVFNMGFTLRFGMSTEPLVVESVNICIWNSVASHANSKMSFFDIAHWISRFKSLTGIQVTVLHICDTFQTSFILELVALSCFDLKLHMMIIMKALLSL